MKFSMQVKYIRFFILIFALFIMSNQVFARNVANVSTPELYQMNFDELINLDVSVASVKPENIIRTPAIVSSYNIKDFEKMGLRSLIDILSFIPGLMIQSGNNPTESIMVRGLSETFNQKILFLIDDVPYWGASHSQIPLLGIPFEAIERVEVIRGPGAVIYGTNASAGVVKIITKKADAGNSLAIRTGSNKHRNGSGYYSKSFSESVDLSIGFEAQKEDGYDGFFKNSVKLPYLPDDQQTSGYIAEKMNMKSVLAKLRVDKLNLLAQTFQSLQTGSLGAAPTNPNKPAQLQSNGALLHADYSWNIDKSSVKAYTDYNVAYIESWEDNYLPGVERRTKFAKPRDTYRWRSGLTLNYRMNEDFSVFIGSEYEYRAVGEYDLLINKKPVLKPLSKQNLDESSFFGQLDYTLDKFRFVVGARYTNNQYSGEAITPRASLIYSLDNSQSLKFLYSEGFNSPNFLQTNVNFPFLGGNKNLSAEIIKTLDIAYNYSKNGTLFVINAYRLVADDLITRVMGETRATYDNSGKIIRHGLELDLQHRRGNWQGFFNAAYIYEGNKQGINDPEAFHTPEYTANLGLHYSLLTYHGIGTSMRYVGSRSGIDRQLIWNLDYQFRYDKFELFASLRNLLGQASYSRDTAQFSPQPVPVFDPKMNFLVGLKYYF